MEGWGAAALHRSGFDRGLPHLPIHLVRRLDPNRGGTRILLFALVRWSLETMDEAHRRAGRPLSDEELKTLHLDLVADLTGCQPRSDLAGDALDALGLSGGVSATGLPILTGQTSIVAGYIAAWCEASATGDLDAAMRTEMRQKAQQMLLQLTGMLIAMLAADDALDPRHLKGQLKSLRVGQAGRLKVAAWLQRPPNHAAVLKIGGGFEPKALILTGLIASALDGHQSEAELDYLADLGQAAGLDEAEINRLAAITAHTLFANMELVERLWTHGTVRQPDWQEDLRANSERIAHELKQTGSAFGLLGNAARGRRLKDEEWSTLRTTLSDLGRAIPALAIFAMPGGALLLPAAARALPFDLRPASFRESHQAPSWFGELADPETLFLDDPTREFTDPGTEDP